MVVEVPTHVDREGARPIPQAPLPAHVRGLIQMLGAYQAADRPGGVERNAR